MNSSAIDSGTTVLNTEQAVISRHTPDEVAVLIRQLRHPALAQRFLECKDDPEFLGLSFTDQIYELLASECTRRKQNGIVRKRAKAEVPSDISVSELLEDRARYHITRSTGDYLSQCTWIDKGEHIIVLGKAGCGKTSVTCACLNSAIESGHKVLFADYSLTMMKLSLLYSKGSNEDFQEQIGKLASHDAIALDDAFTGLSREGEAGALKELLTLCKSSGCAIVLNSQATPKEWHKFLGGKYMADAALDRLMAGARVIKIEGESLRCPKSGRKADSKAEHDSASEDKEESSND